MECIAYHNYIDFVVVWEIVWNIRIRNRYLLFSSGGEVKGLYFTSLPLNLVKDEAIFTDDHYIGMDG